MVYCFRSCAFIMNSSALFSKAVKDPRCWTFFYSEYCFYLGINRSSFTVIINTDLMAQPSPLPDINDRTNGILEDINSKIQLANVEPDAIAASSIH